MNLLNLACGNVRPQSKEWTNADNLHEVLAPDSPERTNLDRESNYRNFDITQPLPFPDESFDAVLASHCIEHFDCHQGVAIMQECRRILRSNGRLVVSVPNIDVFWQHEHEDTVENAVRLFGEPIHLPDGATNFRDYAIWNRFHKTIFSPAVLKAYFVRAGFGWQSTVRPEDFSVWLQSDSPIKHIIPLLNRLPFSLIVEGAK